MKQKIFLFLMAVCFISPVFSNKALAAEGDVWITPVNQDVGASQHFDIEIHADTGGKTLGAFNFFFDFTAAKMTVDTTLGVDGLNKGVDGANYNVLANPDDLANGHYRFAGIAASGGAVGNNVHLITIHAVTTAGFTTGTSSMALRINEMANELGVAFATGTPTGATITYQANDVTAPTLSAGAPSGTLNAGTTSVNLTLTTNENATCKYGIIPNTAYASIANTFATTGGTSQSQSLTGLIDGTSYNYYVRCIDGTGNANLSDYTIGFGLDNPPTNISLSNASINENVAANTVVGALTTTDSDGGDTFTYSLACSTPGADDASFNISTANLRSSAVFDFENKASYAICIRTDDGHNGIFDKNFTISVNDLEDIAPTISAFVIPTTATSLTVPITTFTATDNIAVTGYCLSETNSSTGCSWSGTPQTQYIFSTGGAKTLYAFARDAANNISTSASDSVTITLSDTTTPTLSAGAPSGTLNAGTTSVNLTLTTNENATCKYGIIPNTAYASIANTFATTGGTSQSQSLTGLADGVDYHYYVRCSDSSNNINTSDYTINFSVADATIVTCTSFTYSAWTDCQPDETQTRTVTSQAPSGCTGGFPVLSQSCSYAGGEEEPEDVNVASIDHNDISPPYLKFASYIKEKLKGSKTFYSKRRGFNFKGQDSAIAGGTVKLYEGSDKEDEYDVKGDGKWSLRTYKKDNDTYEYKIKYYDANGKEVDSRKYTIRIDVDKPVFTDLPAKLYKAKGGNIWWKAKDNVGIEKFKVTFNGLIYNIDAPQNKKDEEIMAKFDIPDGTAAGLYGVTIKAYDKAGNTFISNVSASVR